MLARKSTTRRPLASAIHASATFHSRGTVQSKIGVPLGTSVTSSGTTSLTSRSVSRTPSPVRLRGSGKSRRASS